MKLRAAGILIAFLSAASAQEPKSEAEHLKAIRESMQVIQQGIYDLRTKELTEEEIESLLHECKQEMVGTNQIQTTVLGYLFHNPSLTAEQKERTRELLLKRLEYHWLDDHKADQLITPFLFSLNEENDELLQPAVKIYSSDLWEEMSPAAERIYMESIYSAHKKAILFDLVRRKADLELEEIEKTEQ